MCLSQEDQGSILPKCFKIKKCLELKKAPGKKQDSGKYCLKTNPAIVSLSLFKIQAKFQASRKLCLKMNTVGKEIFACDPLAYFLPRS